VEEGEDREFDEGDAGDVEEVGDVEHLLPAFSSVP
jgi:hypothetical protein